LRVVRGRLLVAVVLAGLSLLGAVPTAAATAPRPDPGPFRGLGAWVDVFDYSPRVQSNGHTPPVTPGAVDDMAKLGVRTLYLQVGRDDAHPTVQLVDDALVRAFVREAHRSGMRVVAWYLPSLDDIAADLRPVEGIAKLDVDGRGVDGIAVDMESTESVPDLAARDARLVTFTKRVRTRFASVPVGAIVYPAVQLEIVNPVLWPTFPYRKLAPSIDVWLPMSYSTFRDGTYHDPARYAEESVDRLRIDLHQPSAAVHLIGGIADSMSADDTAAFVDAAARVHAVGWSLYDYNTTASSAWPWLTGAARTAASGQ
jgi:hypothetical protein